MSRYFYCLSIFVALALGTQFASAQQSAELPRRAFLGVQASPLTEEQQASVRQGVNIARVFPDSTASAYGLQEGQIILQANGVQLNSPGELPAALSGLRSGAQVEFLVQDDDGITEMLLELRAFPGETYVGGGIRYGSLATVNGQQRSILTLPESSRPPVVYILQGFGCSSIDMALNQGASMAQLVEQLHSAGFATYRVEKTGLGDSVGANCSEIGFAAETEGFKAGLEALSAIEDIDRDRIYLLGISLGGVWAPILAQKERVAGIISFSTISKTWPEYMYDNWRRQWTLAGKSATETDQDLKLANAFWYQLINEELRPETIFEDSQLQSLAPSVGYQEATQQLFGRHYTFVRELAQTNIISYWEKLRVPTLLMWGRGDYIASESDQQLIRDVLQNNEVDVELQYLDVDHYWQEAGDFATAWGNLRNGNRPPINTNVYSSIIDWLSARG